MFPGRRISRRALFLAVATSCFFLLGHVCSGSDSQWQTVRDVNGQPVDPFSQSAKAVVFVFARTDCPISNRYAPEVRRLHSQFSRKGVVFWLVYPESDLTPDAIRKHVKDYAYPCAALQDTTHRLVQFCRARVTPEAAVLTADGQLVYHGRIDDRYVAFGKWRPAPTRRDLEDAINAVLQGNPPPTSKPAVGCTISPAQ